MFKWWLAKSIESKYTIGQQRFALRIPPETSQRAAGPFFYVWKNDKRFDC